MYLDVVSERQCCRYYLYIASDMAQAVSNLASVGLMAAAPAFTKATYRWWASRHPALRACAMISRTPCTARDAVG